MEKKLKRLSNKELAEMIEIVMTINHYPKHDEDVVRHWLQNPDSLIGHMNIAIMISYDVLEYLIDEDELYPDDRICLYKTAIDYADHIISDDGNAVGRRIRRMSLNDIFEVERYYRHSSVYRDFWATEKPGYCNCLMVDGNPVSPQYAEVVLPGLFDSTYEIKVIRMRDNEVLYDGISVESAIHLMLMQEDTWAVTVKKKIAIKLPQLFGCDLHEMHNDTYTVKSIRDPELWQKTQQYE
jgi:hypothetical protein